MSKDLKDFTFFNTQYCDRKVGNSIRGFDSLLNVRYSFFG